MWINSLVTDLRTLAGNHQKIHISLAFMLILSSPVFADETATRDVSGFQAIRVSSGIELVLHQGDRYQVVVRSDTDDPDDVETEVSRDTLNIHKTEYWFGALNFHDWFSSPRYTVDVTLPVLTTLVVSGGSHAVFDSEFTGDHLTLVTSGGSRVNFKGKLGTLEVRASGGSVSSFEGSAGEFTARTSGGSQLRALKLEAKSADISASGGSSVAITVRDELTVHASGGSRVRYAGDPVHKDINAAHSASVSSH